MTLPDYRDPDIQPDLVYDHNGWHLHAPPLELAISAHRTRKATDMNEYDQLVNQATHLLAQGQSHDQVQDATALPMNQIRAIDEQRKRGANTPAAASHVTTTGSLGGRIEAMLTRADTWPSKRVRGKAEKIREQIAQLGVLLSQETAAVEAKAEQEKAQAAARDLVAKAQKALDEAKAAAAKVGVRTSRAATGEPKPKRTANWSPEKRAAQADRIRAVNARKAAERAQQQAAS